MEDSPTPRDLVALQTAGPVPLASLRSLWWRVPTVAAAYFVAARLGFLLDLEPGFASSIWPAAGIGSAALLIWGAPPVARRVPRFVPLQLVAVGAADRRGPGHHPHRHRHPGLAGHRRRRRVAGAVLRQPGPAGAPRRPCADQRPQRHPVPADERTGVVPGVGVRRRQRSLAVWRPAARGGVGQLVHVVDGRLDRRAVLRAAHAARVPRGPAAPARARGAARHSAHRRRRAGGGGAPRHPGFAPRAHLARDGGDRERAPVPTQLPDHQPAPGRTAADARAADRPPAVRRIRRPDARRPACRRWSGRRGSRPPSAPAFEAAASADGRTVPHSRADRVGRARRGAGPSGVLPQPVRRAAASRPTPSAGWTSRPTRSGARRCRARATPVRPR